MQILITIYSGSHSLSYWVNGETHSDGPSIASLCWQYAFRWLLALMGFQGLGDSDEIKRALHNILICTFQAKIPYDALVVCSWYFHPDMLARKTAAAFHWLTHMSGASYCAAASIPQIPGTKRKQLELEIVHDSGTLCHSVIRPSKWAAKDLFIQYLAGFTYKITFTNARCVCAKKPQ